MTPNEIIGMLAGGLAALALLAYFLLRKGPELPSDYERGLEDGYQAACRDNLARWNRLRNHDPEKCELCKVRTSRPCTCQREASQEA